jgi:hypothetical protein
MRNQQGRKRKEIKVRKGSRHGRPVVRELTIFMKGREEERDKGVDQRTGK